MRRQHRSDRNFALGCAAIDWNIFALMRSSSTFVKRLVPTAGANLLIGALGVITGVMASRWLGPTGRGELAAIQLWPGFLAVAAMLGLPDAMVYFAARQQQVAARYLTSSLALALLASTAVMAASYLAMPSLLQAQGEDVLAVARVYLLGIPITVILTISYQTVRGLGHFRLWNAMRFLPPLVWLGVLLLAWSTSRTSAAFLAAANLIGLALLLPLVAVVLWRVLRRWKWPDPRNWRPLLRFGLPSMFSAIPLLLNLRLDQLVMAAFLPAQNLGLYVVAVTWSTIMSPVLNAVGMVLFPQVASMSSQQAQVDMVSIVSRLSVGISVLFALALGLVTPLGLPLLFGDRFRPAVIAAVILVGASAISTVNQVLQEGARGLGRPSFPLWAEVGGLLVTGACLWLLLPPYGIIGAALASVIGYASVTALMLWQMKRSFQLGPMRYLAPTGGDWGYLVAAVQRGRSGADPSLAEVGSDGGKDAP